MSVRILHCSDNIKNFNTCVEKQICGFSNRGQDIGDVVYLAVKVKNKSVCGARCKLSFVTDENPWDDGVDYANIVRATDFEFCKPFSLSFLADIGGPYWGLKYAQGAKAIKDQEAINQLDSHFIQNKIESFIPFNVPSDDSAKHIEKVPVELDNEESIDDSSIAEEIVKANPDLKMDIMGTFQAIQFVNESDKINGLETLVNENFYSLFSFFQEENTVLVPENRKFMIDGVYKEDGSIIPGIRSIPDALLLKFDPNMKDCPLQVNLIEYECYGQKKNTASIKSNYLNSTIIPQLMRFAAGFSIITDRETRRKTVDNWIDKFMEYIARSENSSLENKMVRWVKSLNPNLNERAIYSEIEKLLRKAFETNIRVLLIIDELSREQKATIKNIINAFKLENGCIGFDGYVVSLVQRINIKDMSAQYALTVQN